MGVDTGLLRHIHAQVLELRFLLVPREGHAALLPQRDALLQGGVVERATAPQDRLKLALLSGCRLELLLVSLVYRLLAHGCRSRFPSRMSTRFDSARRRSANRMASLSRATPYRSWMVAMAARSASSSRMGVIFRLCKVYHNDIRHASGRRSGYSPQKPTSPPGFKPSGLRRALSVSPQSSG